MKPFSTQGYCQARSRSRANRIKSVLPVMLAVATLLMVGIDSASAADKDPLKVGVREVPPFVTKASDGDYDGISIRLWREIAYELELDYEFIETDLEGLLGGLREGSLDAAVAALTVTPERELDMDFSHPFYTAGLGIATAERAAIWRQDA